MPNFIIVGNGFIGNHLAWNLKSDSTYVVGKDFSKDIQNLPKDKSYCVIWCQGSSRGDDYNLYMSQAFSLGSCLSSFTQNKIHIDSHVYISSLYANTDTQFGKIKKLCEDMLLSNANCPIDVLRLPNIYGSFKEIKQNSILSKWFLSDEDITVDGSSRFYMSLDQLTLYIEKVLCKPKEQTHKRVVNIVNYEPTKVFEIGRKIADLKCLKFTSIDTHPTFSFEPDTFSGSVDYVPTTVLEDLFRCITGSEFSREMLASVTKSSRVHISPINQTLFDLEAYEYNNLKRVYCFDLLSGHKRGKHYHRHQTEVFSPIFGDCEIYLQNERGHRVSIPLSFGDKLKVKPNIQHTFWSPKNPCVLLTTSDYAYVDNSTPDVYVF